MWIMKAARVHTRSSVARWIYNGYVEFVDLLKNARQPMFLISVSDQARRLAAPVKKSVRAELPAVARKSRVS